MIEQSIRRVGVIARTLLKRKLDGLDLLRVDHMKVEVLFAQVKASKNKKRRQGLFTKIRDELTRHAELEEAYVYPLFEKDEDASLRQLVLEAYEEHKQVKTLLREIDKLTAGSEKFDAKLNLLIENVMHHVREEETKFFPKVRRRLDSMELDELASKLRSTKREKAAAA